MNLGRIGWICLLLGASFVLSCKTSLPREEQSRVSSFEEDPDVYDPHQGNFLKSNRKMREAALWFEDVPLSSSGIPMIMFRVFSDFAPDIWGTDIEDLSHLGLPRRTERKYFFDFLDFSRPALPVGMGYHRSQKKIIPFDLTSVQVVGLSCGACHTGRVRLDTPDTDKDPRRDTSIRYLLGGTSQQFDPNAFGDAVYRTVNRPDFTGARFRELVQARQNKEGNTWIFNDPKMIPQHLLEMQIFMKKKDDNGQLVSDSVVQAVRTNVLQRQGAIDKVLGPLYTEQTPSLYGGSPGQADALGKIAVISGAQPLTAAPVDLPTVWRQDTREYAQFDGSIRDPLFRNLAASFGVGGVAVDVNVVNASIVADLVMKLPAPKYPFGIDTAKAQKGRVLFAQYCAACHGSAEPGAEAKTVRVPFSIDRGASQARAVQLDSEAIALIAKSLKETCETGQKRDSRTPLIPGSYETVRDNRCEVDNNEILFDQSKTPGTVAQPLPGIWSSAPYLHNGSVPTLRALLVPSLRPKTFYRGNLTYNQKDVGFNFEQIDADFATFDPKTGKQVLKISEYTNKPVANILIYDTSLKGNSNQGHSTPEMLGRDWSKFPEELDQLLEYLKTI